jgi:hypothetical protein
MKTIIRDCDIYAHGPRLLIDTNERLKTTYGGILSCLTFIVTITAIWFLGNDIIYRLNPQILIQPAKEFNITPWYLGVGKDYYYSLLLTYENETTGYLPNVLNMTYQQGEFKRYPNATFEINHYPMKSSRCNGTIHFPNDKDRWKRAHTHSAECLDPNETIVIRNSHDVATDIEPEYYARMMVSRCRNGTKSGQVCLSKEEQDKVIKGSSIKMKYKNSFIDPINYTHPEMVFWEDNFMYIDPNGFKKIFIYYKKNYLITDDGFLFQNLNTKIIYEYDSIRETSLSVDGDDLIEIRIYIDTEVNFVFRNYMKLWDLAASTGGIYKLVTTICTILTELFNRHNLYFYMISNFYEVTSHTLNNSIKENNYTRKVKCLNIDRY